MTRFFYCNTCDEVIATAGKPTEHYDENHDVKVLSGLDELRKYGIARDPNAPTSSTNAPAPINISGVRKRVAYIGRTGKEIKKRLYGSRTTIKYFHVDELTQETTQLSEKEYYALLFADGIPPTDLLHTFNSKQVGHAAFELALTDNRLFAYVTINPEDPSDLLFSQHASYDSLSAPYDKFLQAKHSHFRTNATSDEAYALSSLSGKEKIIYYDLLSPRNDELGVPCLARILITAVYEDSCEEALNGASEKQLIAYELSQREIDLLYRESSFDWSSAIVQDARSILCSQS